MNKVRVSIIVAIDKKNGIGKNNDLLFRIPEDMQRVRSLTNGHPIIMGRKTFESIGRILPNRTNIVVTRNEGQFRLKNPSITALHGDLNGQQAIIVVHRLEDAIKRAKKNPGAEEIFIFGGGQIFKEAIEKGLIDRLYLTIVKGDFGADTFFPDYSMFTKVLHKEEHESDGYSYTFLDLEK